MSVVLGRKISFYTVKATRACFSLCSPQRPSLQLALNNSIFLTRPVIYSIYMLRRIL